MEMRSITVRDMGGNHLDCVVCFRKGMTDAEQVSHLRHLANEIENPPQTNEEMCIAGICCDCGGKMEPITPAKISEIKEDMGMGEDDDFCDCCSECAKKYMPQTIS